MCCGFNNEARNSAEFRDTIAVAELLQSARQNAALAQGAVHPA